MSRILIGTSGYYYDDWRGEFYPAGTAKKDYLIYYAQHFNILELNYTYYRIPDAKHSLRMIEDSKGKLEFVVKAYRGMTHEISEESINEHVPRFLEGISPFISEGKLGAILLQFSQSFHYNNENRWYLKSLIEELLPLPLSVEFRRKEWLKDSVFNALRELDVGFVCVDEPDLPALIPSTVISTSGIGYIRFHGRNKKSWYGTDSTKRYDYLYSQELLSEWVPKIRELADKTDKVFVFFNNHAKAQAITNANMLSVLLR